MERHEASELVVGLLAAQRSIDPAAIQGGHSLLDDIGLDSLDATELLVALHQRIGLKLRIDQVEDFGTVDELVSLLLSQLAGERP
jgi:acyl carrier protein